MDGIISTNLNVSQVRLNLNETILHILNKLLNKRKIQTKEYRRYTEINQNKVYSRKYIQFKFIIKQNKLHTLRKSLIPNNTFGRYHIHQFVCKSS